MKRTFLPILSVLLICFGVVACSKPDASFASLEDARGTARENAMWNAQTYRQANVLYRGWDIVGRGDSTQSPSCPQGDGWATMDFVSPAHNAVVKVKCSTVSGNLACMEDSDFKTKSFSSEDGSCQGVNKFPYPLPKIAH